MGKEIERKFLVQKDKLPELDETYYCQGYLSTDPERTVRVRTVGISGYLTIKGRSEGAVRSEYEYEIPYSEANEMLNNLCLAPLIEKFRSEFKFGGLIWEIDRFIGENEGLIIAEVELKREDQNIKKPDWVGEEVTGELRYYNSRLSQTPYSRW